MTVKYAEKTSLGYSEESSVLLCRLIKKMAHNPFYKERFNSLGIVPEEIKGVEDLPKLPFTTKEDLRETYPLGLQIAPDRDVVRVHSSSGTTGQPVMVPYTRNDVNTWAEMMSRCLKMAGVTDSDRIQITPGYGLWTAGIGFQAGTERLGAMAVPIGPGNTDRQLKMMVDLKTTVLIGTSSYALLLAEEANRRGLTEKLHLRLGVFGSERWGEKMRTRIEELIGIETFDIYGLTEIYGPGIAIDCPHHTGLHYWDDHLIFEIVDPFTGKPLTKGSKGELVITTITKEGMPLLRFRTRDITRIIPARCSCGSPYPMIDRIIGRSDDMIKIKGVQIYPAEIENILKGISGLSSEYQIEISRTGGKERAVLRVERQPFEKCSNGLARICEMEVKSKVGLSMDVEIVEYNQLPRSEKKTKRVIDHRDCC
ncbi:MAG: phenylacetate--CoA ligase family protein [Bacillota bacterium]|jgi:phenylacetate-CoA ligase